MYNDIQQSPPQGLIIGQSRRTNQISFLLTNTLKWSGRTNVFRLCCGKKIENGTLVLNNAYSNGIYSIRKDI
jgi:hypothetical protein